MFICSSKVSYLLYYCMKIQLSIPRSNPRPTSLSPNTHGTSIHVPRFRV